MQVANFAERPLPQFRQFSRVGLHVFPFTDDLFGCRDTAPRCYRTLCDTRATAMRGVLEQTLAMLLARDIHPRHQPQPLLTKATAETIRLTLRSANQKIAARTTDASDFINEVGPVE